MFKTTPDRLRSFIESTGLSYKLGSSAFIFTCPRCSKKEKLWIRRTDGVFRCWSCSEVANFKGRAEYALAELLNSPIKEIREKLYDFAPLDENFQLHLEIHDPWADETEESLILAETFPETAWPLDFYPILSPESTLGLNYLNNRGIPAYIANLYDLHYIPFKSRVCFPVKINGKLIGWQSRTILNNRYEDYKTGEIVEFPKIMSSNSLSGVRDRILMFQDNLLTSNHALICEGPIDAIKAHYCGGAVATMGKVVSKQQLRILKNLGVSRIYLGLDEDAAEETNKIITELLADAEIYRLDIKDRDLGSMSFEEVYELFLDAKRMTGGEFFVYIKDWY